MDTFFIQPFILGLQSLPAEVVSLILLFACALSLLTLFKLWGENGLYIYNCVAVLASNIQVMRAVQFQFNPEPVALGTIVFATTYLCSDLLTEHYGKESARRGVGYCFAAQAVMTLLMIVAVGYPLLPEKQLITLGFGSVDSSNPFRQAEIALALLFTPSPRILIASLTSFAISQLNDIWIFQALSKVTQGRWLWFRTFVAGGVSSFVDTVLFSVLAWIVFAPNPVTWHSLFFTYILGSFVTRLLMNLLITPVMYLSYALKPKQKPIPIPMKTKNHVSEF